LLARFVVPASAGLGGGSGRLKAELRTRLSRKWDAPDRYLADVFLATDAGELFLNNELLVNGQAVRKDAWQFRDWEPDLVA
jgi:hypothetical protein